MKKILILFGYLSLASGLSSCGEDSEEERRPPNIPSLTLSGFVVDAPIADAQVCLYSYPQTNPQSNPIVPCTSTTQTGTFTFAPFNLPSQTVLIEINSGSYVDEYSQRLIALERDQHLSAVTMLEAGRNQNINVTALTTLSRCYADYLATERDLTAASAITTSVETLSNHFHLSDIRYAPLKPLSVPTRANSPIEDDLRHGYILAGLSGLAALTSIDAGIQPGTHFDLSSIELIQLMCRDIKSDGLLDGLSDDALGGTLNFGSTPINTQTYLQDWPRSLLTIADLNLNGSNIDRFHLLPFADELVEVSPNLFPDNTQQPPRLTLPTIANAIRNMASPLVECVESAALGNRATPLEFVHQLKVLNCDDQNIEDLSGLHRLSHLEELSLQGNRLSGRIDLTPFRYLRIANLGENSEINDIDITTNWQLESLNVSTAHLNYDVPFDISHLEKLKHLDLSGHPSRSTADRLKSLDITQNTLLETLRVVHQDLDRLDLSLNPDIRILRLGSNRITDIDLTHLPALIDLHIGVNQLSSLNLINNPLIEQIDLFSNNIDDLERISTNGQLAHLNFLNLDNNPLIQTNFMRFRSLQKLRLQNVGMTGIDLSPLTSLTALNLNGNDLQELNIAQNTLLKSLLLRDNMNLSSLDISHQASLFTLNIENTAITRLNVPESSSLERENIFHNPETLICFNQPEDPEGCLEP